MTNKSFSYILIGITVSFSWIAHAQIKVNDSIVSSIHRFKQHVAIKSVIPVESRFLCLDEAGNLFFVDSKSAEIDSGINQYSTHYDFDKLQLINDVIVGTEGYEKKYRRYYLDLQKKKWARYRIKKYIYPGDLIFQDDDYFISTTCSGEWGGTIYFTNKKTSKTYESECTCAVNVIKQHDYYNVTSSLSHMIGLMKVFNVKDPELLKVHSRRKPHSILDSLGSTGIATNESNSTKGTEKLIDTVGATCAGSFIFHNNILYIIEYTPLQGYRSVWIDSIRNHKFVRLYDLTHFGVSEADYDFSYKGTIISTFLGKDFWGFIYIADNKMNLYIFDRIKK